jgi:hypothetical protein
MNRSRGEKPSSRGSPTLILGAIIAERGHADYESPQYELQQTGFTNLAKTDAYINEIDIKS